jgi:mRNA interferase MazF
MPGNCARGEVFKVRLDPAEESEIKKTRPCVILQNNVGNRFSPNTIVAAITDAENVPRLFPVNVPVKKGEGGLERDSVVLLDQIRTVGEHRLTERCGQLKPDTMQRIDAALKISLGLK